METVPVLIPFLRTATDDAGPRPLVIVAPGGGYMWLTLSEGPPVCDWLNSAGFHCAVLKYRVLRLHPAPLLDARRAVQLVRQHAPAWGVDPSLVGMLGFSAGGHVAGLVALSWNNTVSRQTDALMLAAGDLAARQPARVSAAVLAYPVVSAHNDSVGTIGRGASRCKSFHCVGWARRGGGRPIRHHGSMAVLLGTRLGSTLPRSREDVVSLDHLALSRPETPPPFFLWHTASDDIVPSANSAVLASALQRRGVPVEMRLYSGPNPPLKHGLGLARELRSRQAEGAAEVANWSAVAADWLRRVLHVPPRDPRHFDSKRRRAAARRAGGV